MASNLAPITPAQIRAGRALLGWSQEELAKKASVGLSTVRDYEKERRAGEIGSLKVIREALENNGVIFLQGDDDFGPGVRLYGLIPNVLRWPEKTGQTSLFLIRVEWRGKRYDIFVPDTVLDDCDESSNLADEAGYLRVLSVHRDRILQVSKKVIDTRGCTPDGRVYLESNDFWP